MWYLVLNYTKMLIQSIVKVLDERQASCVPLGHRLLVSFPSHETARADGSIGNLKTPLTGVKEFPMKTESTSLTSLPQKKITTGLKRLQEAGITPERWLTMLDADSAAMQRLSTAWPGGATPPVITVPRGTGIVYDAVAMSRILGLPCDCNDPVPQAAYGEIVVYYGGWDLRTLRLSPAGQKRMRQDQDWYERHGWKVEPGYYGLLLPVLDSNRKKWEQQLQHLAGIDPAWQASPICVAATGLLAHLVETGNDLLKNDWCRCAEALPDDHHAGLSVNDGRVGVNGNWDDNPDDDVWLSAARKIRTLTA